MDTESFIFIFLIMIYTIGRKSVRYIFDLSKSEMADLKNDTNNMVLGKFKCENKKRPISEFIALNSKCYNSNYLSTDHLNEKPTG